MNSNQNLPYYILLILYIITGSLGNNGAIDILAPQWVYLGAVNILTCLFFLFNPNSSVNTGLSKLFEVAFYIWVYLFYFIWSGLSYFYAINSTETLLNIPKSWEYTFCSFFLFSCYFTIWKIRFKSSTAFSLGFCSLSCPRFTVIFFTELESPDFTAMNLKGVAGNKNITSASIAFKIPFVLFSLISASRKLVKGNFIYHVVLSSLCCIHLICSSCNSKFIAIVFFNFYTLFVTFTLFGNKQER